MNSVVAVVIVAMGTGLAGGTPYPLAETESMDHQIKVYAEVATQWLETRGQNPSEYVVEAECTDGSCDLHLYRSELLAPEYQGWRGCPKQICVTLRYDCAESAVTNAVHWR